MQNAELIKDFVEETGRHTDTIETGLIKLETGNGDAGTINDIFRAAHSIKGTAGFFALGNIVSLAHAMESLLEEIRSGHLVIDRSMIDALLAANDRLKDMAGNVEASDQMDISGHLERIARFGPAEAQPVLPAAKPNRAQPASGAEERKGDGAEDMLKAIRDAAGQGCNAYRISCTAGAAADNSPPRDLVKKIESIGQVAGFFGRHLFFTTVLEKDLAAIALGIPEDGIAHMDDPDDFEYMVTALESTGLEMDTSRPGPANSAESPSPPASPAPPPAQAAAGETRKILSADDSVRVHVSLLNDLLDLASEMVLGRNQLLRVLSPYRKEIPGLNGVLQNIDGITTDLQEKIMQTRMQPLAKVFNKFPRFIRELSRKMGKDVELQMEGIDVELDKSIIEALGDPLTHLVRNAVDHGIEDPETRVKAGKPRAGTITLNAYHEGGHVNIDIIDNGAGINIDNIKKKALQSGVISPAEAALMGERELLGLLFRPGFSTAEKVTDLSGRGVGLDVVRTNIEKLGGVLEIMTSHGRGANFRLILPLTLAIIPSLIVEVKGQKFALPQVNLQEMLRVKPGDNSRRIEMIGGAPVMRLRGKLIPIIHLAGVLGLDKSPPDTGQILRTLVIKSGFKRFGLVVDRIHDGEEILVKHLPRYLSGCKCYSGVTILGDGRTAMILDPEGIAAKAGLRFMDRTDEKSAGDAVTGPDGADDRQSLLLFKCSGPETFGLDLSMVARVEKIQSDQIEKIGKNEFIQFRGEALRVIRPEKYLPVGRSRKRTERQYVIIPKNLTHTAGILIEKILDAAETAVRLNTENIKAPGLAGSAILNGRVVIMVDLAGLLSLACPDRFGPEKGTVKGAGQKTVLLVEDTPFFSQTERKYLESAGYRVIMAANGIEAWKILQENRVDAVISDIEMPVMDGIELVKKIRSSRKFSGLPVVAVTSRADEASRKAGMEAGFDFYEIKLNPERFLEKVRMAVLKGCDAG